jgi:hypothetical protein
LGQKSMKSFVLTSDEQGRYHGRYNMLRHGGALSCRDVAA